jgi:hypothetical protein
METGQIFEDSQDAVIDWLKTELQIKSRAELKENQSAAIRFWSIKEEYEKWKLNV